MKSMQQLMQEGAIRLLTEEERETIETLMKRSYGYSIAGGSVVEGHIMNIGFFANGITPVHGRPSMAEKIFSVLPAEIDTIYISGIPFSRLP